MSAPIVQSDYEALDGLARRFQEQNQQMIALKQRVDRGVNALRNGGWQGAGSTAFTQEMERTVNPATQRLIDALQEAKTVTLQVKELIRAAEEEAARVFQGAGNAARNGTYPPGGAMTEIAQPNNGITPPLATPGAVTAIPPRDHALLSQAAYADGGELPQELKDKGWRIMRIGQTDTGYFGVAYVNDRTNEVVIAHRGTNPDVGDVVDGLVMASPVGLGSAIVSDVFGIENPLRAGMRAIGINSNGNDFDDDAQLALHRAPDQFHESQAFVRSVMSQVQSSDYAGYTVSHTGHSLGAVLADLHGAQHGQSAITFDNPGSKEILDNMNVLYDREKHISYQSHPNLVNTANTPAGHSVNIRLQTESDKFGIIRDTLHDHSLDNIVDAIDPVTGNFYRATEPTIH